MTQSIQTTQASQLPVTMGFNDLASFEFMQRTAKMFSASTMVPTAYQGMVTKGYGDRATIEANPAALSNCMIALDMSQRMNANPLMIMQNLHIIEGRPSWSSQFIIAAINNCGKFSPLRFDLEWLDEIEATYSTFEWTPGNNGKNFKKEQKHVVKVRNARCVAWAIEKATGERLESAPVTMEMSVNEGWFGKNGSKWKSMPDLMMRYRSAAFFGRIYAPELLMGLPAAEELHDVFTVDADGGFTESRSQAVPKATATIDPHTGEVREGPANYPQADFEKNLPQWAQLVASDRKTLADLVAMVSTKGALTAEQQAALAAQVQRLQANTVEATPVSAPPAQPDPAPAGGPGVTFEQVRAAMAGAANLDALFEAADLMGEVPDPERRAQLAALFDARQLELEAS